MNNRKKTIIMAAGLIILIAAVVIAWAVIKPGTVEGAKRITVTVQHLDGQEKNFIINTDEEYLRGALEQEDLVSGNETEFGLYLLTVDGETADYDKDSHYWAFYIDGEYAMTGVDSTPIEDGKTYAFKYE